MLQKNLLCLSLLLLIARPGGAQVMRTLEPGDQVRVLAPTLHQGPLRGAVVRYVTDTLAVRERLTDSVYTLPFDAIRGLARNEGLQRRRSVRHGAAVGAFLGGSLGLVLGPFMAREGREGSFVRTTALSGGAGMALGGGLGALLGSLLAGDHWQRYSMPASGPATAGPAVVKSSR